VAAGHSVEWFSASFAGAPGEEDLDGVRIVRAGRQWSVHIRAFIRYQKSLSDRFDAVIDEVNTVPFFTPLWARIPTYMLIFQLARDVWWYETPLPLSLIGYVIEPLYLMSYRHTTVFTISQSTKDDLSRLRFASQILIIPIGIDNDCCVPKDKAKVPTFIYVGRLAPSKRIAHMLQALSEFRSATGEGELWLVGAGSERYTSSLRKLARKLGIENRVVLFGRLSSLAKKQLMAQAHALLMTSVREGWGLVVTEASACGTPAIVYDVPGLRDSVRNESTGLVVSPRPHSLSEAMIRMTRDSTLYEQLATEGQRQSRSFSYDETARLVRLTLEHPLSA
jgi:glycosyltransferase involved in cell wall biosynthesis